MLKIHDTEEILSKLERLENIKLTRKAVESFKTVKIKTHRPQARNNRGEFGQSQKSGLAIFFENYRKLFKIDRQ